MKSLSFYTLGFIAVQTFISILVSWVVLSCSLFPRSFELYEVVLTKFLYLYDPEACGRTIFYNYTVGDFHGVYFNTVLWMDKNEVAADFRRKIALSLSLHIFWLLLAIVNCYQGLKPCAQYFVYVVFALVGAALLVSDVAHCGLFLMDLENTRTEIDILNYVSTRSNDIKFLDPTTDHMRNILMTSSSDTTWLPLLMAFWSIRGIVLWIVNFYIVKDNFFDGLAKQREKSKDGRNVRRRTTIAL